MQQATIAIIVPVFNREKLLGETLQSVLAQSNPNWECLVVDDGSTDNSPAIAGAFAAKDQRFTVLQREKHLKSGGNDARNLGWQMAKAAWVMFLDSDDLLAQNAVQNRLDFAKHHGYEADMFIFHTGTFYHTIGDSEYIWNHQPANFDDLKLLIGRFFDQDMPWHTTGVLWHKKWLAKTGGWHPQLKVWQDWELHLRALYYKPQLIISEDRPDNFYRLDVEQSIASRYHDPEYKKKVVLAMKLAENLYRDRPFRDEQIRSLINRILIYQPIEHKKNEVVDFLIKNDAFRVLNKTDILLRSIVFQLFGKGYRKRLFKKLVKTSYFNNLVTQGTHLRLYSKDFWPEKAVPAIN